MSKLYISLILIQATILPVRICATFTNNSMLSRRSSDDFSGATNVLSRQFPAMDFTFLLPHLIVGVFIPIAVIIGIGVVLMKLFIIGFWLLGKGGYGFGQNMAPVYPWRVDTTTQQQIQRSLLGRDGTVIPNHLSSTIWQLITKVSNALEKYQKYKS